ncbi:MAG: GDP-mannose 4,6-dehydratase [Rhizobiaceae bacterium]|nr:GDP-mannose 4,6-dehydratase [Rhizobiaceae bacterium]
MTHLITGVAGFIGYHLARTLLQRGDAVVGLDNLNDYYSPELKKARLEKLSAHEGFTFHHTDISDHEALEQVSQNADYSNIIHLAAQAGVRYSLENPGAYVRSNLVGHANMLELARNTSGLRHMIYASSSSVYGGRSDLPFLETDRADKPVSLYAATKKADELMSHTYAHLYDIPLTGLRFFTVYGPMGRPDMAYYSFTRKMIAGEPIEVFNHGNMLRDFTYIDDIIDGILRILDKGHLRKEEVPHAVYNIGNNDPVRLEDFLLILQGELGVEAERVNLPMQPGDVPATYADISAIREDYGFEPKTGLKEGLRIFVQWYRQYYGE